MSDGTAIGWTEATWNAAAGCTKISAGCMNCSALRDAQRLSHNPNPKIAAKYQGTVTADGKNWTGHINFSEDALLLPLKWREPRYIFTDYTYDLFHESIPDEWIDRVFAVMALAPQHIFQVLTKRPERMLEYLGRNQTARQEAIGQKAYDDHGEMLSGAPDCGEAFHYLQWPLPNLWLGVSVEDQPTADKRIPLLLQTPAAVRWISAEPLLGAIDLTSIVIGKQYPNGKPKPLTMDARKRNYLFTGEGDYEFAKLDWVVVGGESGSRPKARPMHPDWVRALRYQCTLAGVPFYFKQIGSWAWVENQAEATHFLSVEGTLHQLFDGVSLEDSDVLLAHTNKKAAGRLLDGRTWDECPS